MRVSLLSPSGRRVLDSVGGEALLDNLHSIVEITSSDGEAVVMSFDDEDIQIPSGVFRIPVQLSNEYVCSFSVSTLSESVSYSLKYPGGTKIDSEQLVNLMQLTESLRLINDLKDNGGISVDDIMEGQQQGDLSLLCLIKPLTGYDNNDLQERLKQDLSQKVRAICSRPKRGTRTDEIVQDVGLVKKTSINTLMHLASHTEHWKARTLTTLRPKRLLSVVIEDELNIYENLFFRAAINEISDYVTRQIRRLNSAGLQKRNADYAKKYADQMGDWKRAQILMELLPGKEHDDFFNPGISLHYQQAIDAWESIDKLLRNIRNSSFYRQINSKQRIGHEIFQTNIIRNDQRYHALYELLVAVRREKEQEAKVHTGISNHITGNPGHFYANYVIVLILWCMAHKLEIAFNGDSVLHLDAEDRLTGSLSGEDAVISYRFTVEYDEYDQVSIRIAMQEKSDQVFCTPPECPVTTELLEQFNDFITYQDGVISFSRGPNADEESRLRKLFQKKTNEKRPAINQAWMRFVANHIAGRKLHTLHHSAVTIKPLFYAPAAKDHLVSNLMNALDSKMDDMLWILADNMMDSDDKENGIRYIINYGEIPVSENSIPYHHGVLPIMQVDSLSSQRIIKYLAVKRATLLMKWEENKPVHCPLCLTDDIRKSGKQTWQCRSCKSKWGKTHCVAANDCDTDFFWIWPDEDHLKSLRNEDVNETSEIRRAQRRDIVFGAGIITDFEYDFRSNGEIQPLPICPCCGKKRSLIGSSPP